MSPLNICVAGPQRFENVSVPVSQNPAFGPLIMLGWRSCESATHIRPKQSLATKTEISIANKNK